MDAIFYFSSNFSLIGACIMGYVCTWKNARVLGKSFQVNTEKENKEIELQSVAVTDEKKSEGTGENENVDITTDGKVNAVDHQPNDSTTSTDNPSS